MRDGVKLFTSVYIPKDTTQSYPFLINRTPYSVAPYGEAIYRKRLGPNPLFTREKYIFVYQDVRGRHMSEGQFEEMTPAIDDKKDSKQVDESSDTYDTIDWLLKNISHNNGKAGIYGISYPGFYATAALPNAHPALKAASPQAPVTDEFEGDDAYHRGAFFLMDNFSFLNFFDAPRNGPRAENPPVDSTLNINEVYDFYLQTGALHHFNDLYFRNTSNIWNEFLAHATKDAYWQARNIRPHLKNIHPATLVVGGWFDAEDLFGALHTYKAIEQQNLHNNNFLIMAPWTHGAWEKKQWNQFAGYQFGQDLNAAFQQIEFNFFNFYLKEKGSFDTTEATIFVTGSNEWKRFKAWPPKGMAHETWWLNYNHQLLLQKGKLKGKDEYTSDPANPVPYINQRSADRLNEYMAADQSFASGRNDVVYYQSEVLQNDKTVLGPIMANLYVSLSGSDADFVVKVIDVLPDSNNTQQLVRAEVLRGKFRNSFENPVPFTPNEPTKVTLQLNDVAHTFLKGHRIMVQVQSSWFPLVDRNPQQFINIPDAADSDYKKERITILHDAAHPSTIEAGVEE
ncbi:CocE/NonD family hydrolase [Ilyomonas limi]|uniref:CocE/NonD family hydrolase n=2 Tax=Ilyomonas limi TaxID=2575867 RepID=A0A4U3KXZ1_9BACT|nr:CocE/NonD family hydrolase [Ilyomonas limi]